MTQPQDDDSELLLGAYDGVPEDDTAEPLDAGCVDDEVPFTHDHEVGQ